MLALPLLFSSASLASDPADFPWKRNADTVVAAIQSGGDLSRIGLADLLSNEELAALGRLHGCSVSSFTDVTKNFASTDWTCAPDVDRPAVERQQAVAMRFRDDGSLFALSINPLKSNYAPTALGVQRTDWPSQEASAKAFAKAVRDGGDVTLDETIPLTSLQRAQLARLVKGRWKIMIYMSEVQKDQARRLLGSDVVFAERPKNGIEIVFSSPRVSGSKDKMVTLYFDNDDRPVGLHIEDSLIAVTSVSERQ